MRPTSPRNVRYCWAAATGLLSTCASSRRAESRMSSPRTPTSGLAANVCCAACSRMSLSAATGTSSAMGCSSMRSLPLARPIVFADQQAQELGNEGGFRLAFDLQRAAELEQHPPAVLRLRREERRTCAHARARLDRRDEANLVQSIVEPGRRIRRDHAELHHHRGDQRQSEIAVGDRPAEWTLAFGARDIHMDPLAIAGAGSKGVDAVLVDHDPAGRTELAADELRRRRHTVLCDRHGLHLWQSAQILAQDLADV